MAQWSHLPNSEEIQNSKMVDGRKLKKNIPTPNSRMKMDIIDWLMKTIKEPSLCDDSVNSKICIAVLNFHLNPHLCKDGVDSLTKFERFCFYIKEYLPLQFSYVSLCPNPNIKTLSEAYKQKLYEFNLWFDKMRFKIENLLAETYIKKGQLRHLEVLKRRYKQTWSESKVVDLTADQNLKVDSDSKIELTIKDA